MPTNRTWIRRTPQNRAKPLAELPQEALEWLEGGDGGTWLFFQTPAALAELWALHGADIVAQHVAEVPGTRPRRWWECDAPGLRQRIGGVGTPCHERLAHAPRYEYGVPVDWIDETLLRAYEHMGRPLNVLAVDPRNPPTYEAEATFLERHNLLLPGERRRLRDDGFAPVAIEIEGVNR